MKKEELINLLKLTGVDEKAIELAGQSYEIGYEEAKHESLKQSSIFKGRENNENKEGAA